MADKQSSASRSYLFSPNLARDWNETRDGYPSFRRLVEDRLKESEKSNIDERLELLDTVMNKYRSRYGFIIKRESPPELLKHLKQLAANYRMGIGDFSREAKTGLMPKAYIDVTTLRNRIMSVMSTYEDKQGPSKKQLDKLYEQVQRGEEALKWAEEMGVDNDDMRSALANNKAAFKLKEAFYEGTYSYVVAGPKGKTRIVPYSGQETGKIRYKNESKKRFQEAVIMLVDLLKYLGTQTMTEAEHETGDLLYATGVSDKPASRDQVHNIRMGRL